MKKILFGIITILGIGLSFCSATNLSFSLFSGTYSVVDNYANKSFLDVSFSDSSYNYKIQPSSIFGLPVLSISGFSSDLYLTKICVSSNYGQYQSYTYFYPTSSYYSSSDSYGYCYSLSGFNINLKDLNYSYIFGVSDTSSFSLFRMKCLKPSFTVKNVNGDIPDIGNSQVFNISFTSLFDSIPDFVLSFSGIRYYDTVPIPYYLEFYIPDEVKFKVNYGNTSYEYELSDNLEIHLKSPVNMSGSYNYIYDGPTGINLFYNNTSDFYSKDKLYLKSMYWYNKNIFTPICL